MALFKYDSFRDHHMTYSGGTRVIRHGTSSNGLGYTLHRGYTWSTSCLHISVRAKLTCVLDLEVLGSQGSSSHSCRAVDGFDERNHRGPVRVEEILVV